ncbi:MAG: hypothetical protein CVT77_07750 [Alphaproteobacteria bacterium HGW-Alphaproteobacteria-16]|nr:MAG: hypothetical protein CVT77_07750 [Alphaproteobacteria bacterium HGW-Alphaproteobacteria-16]
MSPRESKTVDLALAILRTAFENRYAQPDRTPALRLALRVLLPYVDRFQLLTFWNILDNPNPLQRMNHLRKTYAGIEARVIRLGFRSTP